MISAKLQIKDNYFLVEGWLWSYTTLLSSCGRCLSDDRIRQPLFCARNPSAAALGDTENDRHLRPSGGGASPHCLHLFLCDPALVPRVSSTAKHALSRQRNKRLYAMVLTNPPPSLPSYPATKKPIKLGSQVKLPPQHQATLGAPPPSKAAATLNPTCTAL
uniref:Uncharacterized protein TCIL3000_1_1230 n=1 Tax=Trypanosoma congolense (strain IL3000) TaxID=1068625 RepID=G0UJ05_TRYCI|nr:unnamed protein product [Trypanosoma congolense IL3000]